MLRRKLADERGMAMIVVMGVLVILTALAIGALAVSQNDLSLANKDKDTMTALHVAEAGINKMLWQLEQFGNATVSGTYVIPVGEGTATVTAAQGNPSRWYWTISSVGASEGTTRTLKVTVFHFSLWNMNMGLAGKKTLASGGQGVVGNTSVDGPLYVRGNVELSGNSSLTGGPLFIKTGSLVLKNGSAVLGTPSSPVEAYIEPVSGNGDIVDRDGQLILSDPHQSQVFVSRLSNESPDIEMPPVELMNEYRARAASEGTQSVTSPWYWEQDTGFKVGPGQPSGQSESYKVLDSDLSVAPKEVAKHMYKIGNNTASFGSQEGLAWDATSRALYVNGTIYVDGDLTIGDSDNDEINYYGRGTIVANGDIVVRGRLRPPSDVSHSMDSTHVLGLVTDGVITIDCRSSNIGDRNNPDVCGAFFATKEIHVTQNNTTYVGSMIAGKLNFADCTNNSHLFTNDSLPDFLPPSLPGGTRFLALTGSWREVEQ